MTPRHLSSNDTTPSAVQMRQLVADLIDESPMPTPWDDIGTIAVNPARNPQPRRRRPVLVGAIAASIVGLLIVGLVAMNRAEPSGTAHQSTAAPASSNSSALADADDLSSSQWVVAATLPAAMSYQYATVGSVLDAERQIVYQSSNDASQLAISIGSGLKTPSGETTLLGDRTWIVSDADGRWVATRGLESATVSVSGAGQFNADARTILQGLSVVAQSDLPFAPLGIDSELLNVAEYRVDGVVLTLAAQEVNGYYCIWTLDDSEGRGGGCGYRFDPTDIASPADLAVGADAVGGSSTAQVHAGGIVSAAVARVDVEFANGDTVSVNPTDLSGQLDTRFWIAAISVPYTNEDSLAGFDHPVREVRAYNTSGELIATT